MKYQTENAIVDTEKASAHWEEATWWNGNNHISKATGSQWDHQTLYRSSKGRYYLECTSQWQGAKARAEFITDDEAAKWLLNNEHELPKDLSKFEASLVE